MAKTVRKTVHVTDDKFQRHVFKPGDTLPRWAEKLVTNPKVFESDEDATPVQTVEQEPEGTGDQGADSGGDTGEQGDPNAPRGNASRAEWAEYASSRGIEVTGEMKQTDIREAVAKADAEARAAADAGQAQD